MPSSSREDFDAYAARYKEVVQASFAIPGLPLDFFTQFKAEMLAGLIHRYIARPLSEIRILDVGCGVGETDALLLGQFPRIFGTDVSLESLSFAQIKNPTLHYLGSDGISLPFRGASVTAAVAINVMHHIPPRYWQIFLAEVARVVAPDGLVAIFEHNPLNPLTRKNVRSCAFDRDAVLIPRRDMLQMAEKAGLKPVESGYVLFFPFQRPVFRLLERALRAIPLGAQYYVAARKVSSMGGRDG